MGRKRVAIIGAGIAGLAAGHRLKQTGIETVIFESAPFAGGRMSSEKVQGFVIDKGAYTIPETHKYFLRLIRELDLGHHLVETTGSLSVWKGHTEHKMKIGSSKDFLKYRLISLRDKKDLVKLFLYAQTHGSSLDLNRPNEQTFALERETVSDFLLRDYSPALLEHIAYPIFSDLFLGTPEDNSKAAFLSTLRSLAKFRIYTLGPGMGVLTDTLGDKLEVRLKTPVIQVRKNREKRGWVLETGGETAQSEGYDGIVFALPAPLIPKLLPDMPEQIAIGLSTVRYTPSIVAALGLSRPRLDASMMNTFTRKEYRTLATVVLDHYKNGNRIPNDRGLVTAILTKEMSIRLIEAPDAAVARTVLKEMDKRWPGLSDDLLFARIYRWPHAGVQLPPGTLKAQVRLRDALDTAFTGMAFAGDGLYRASMEISLRTGYRAADRIARSI